MHHGRSVFNLTAASATATSLQTPLPVRRAQERAKNQSFVTNRDSYTINNDNNILPTATSLISPSRFTYGTPLALARPSAQHSQASPLESPFASSPARGLIYTATSMMAIADESPLSSRRSRRGRRNRRMQPQQQVSRGTQTVLTVPPQARASSVSAGFDHGALLAALSIDVGYLQPSLPQPQQQQQQQQAFSMGMGDAEFDEDEDEESKEDSLSSVATPTKHVARDDGADSGAWGLSPIETGSPDRRASLLGLKSGGDGSGTTGMESRPMSKRNLTKRRSRSRSYSLSRNSSYGSGGGGNKSLSRSLFGAGEDLDEKIDGEISGIQSAFSG